MPDTIRSLAELNALFGDNNQGTITPQDVRDLMVSMMVYGEIGSGSKSAITLASGFQAMDFNLAGTVGRGLTVDTTNKWISGVPVAMKAKITLEVLFQGTNNTTYNFGVFRNPDGAIEQIARLNAQDRVFNAAGFFGVNVSAYIQLNAGDKLQAGVNGGGAVSFTLVRGVLRVERVAIE